MTQLEIGLEEEREEEEEEQEIKQVFSLKWTRNGFNQLEAR